jgi:hypothetical protein
MNLQNQFRLSNFQPELVLPVAAKVMGLGIGLLLLGSLVIYGISIYIENRVLNAGKETRTLQEDNQDLELAVDRLKSYEKVADASNKVQGLQEAKEIINVPTPTKSNLKLPEMPATAIPKEVYGY